MTDLMKDLTELETAALDSLRQAEQTGEGVRLPFPVGYFHVINGDPRLKKAGETAPALYFGGWACDSDKMGELVDDGAVPALPVGFVAYEGQGEKGSYNGLCARAITISAVANRQRWISGDGTASGPHFDAAKGLTRRHLQLLAMIYTGGKPWGYGVLTAKGFQAQNVLKALGEWERAIAPLKKTLNATQFPLSCFAISLGTAGEQPVYESVGKTAQTKITPIKAIIPSDLDAEKLAKRFIGKNNLAINAERLAMAAEWLAAWKAKDAQRAEPEAPAPDEDPNW
jgi:hypothetical protein